MKRILLAIICVVILFSLVNTALADESGPSDQVTDILWYWPVEGKTRSTAHFTSYVKTRNGRNHYGIDTDYTKNRDCLAARAGIAYKGYNGSSGNYVIIDHEDGYYTRYAHLDSIIIKNGQKVSAGQKIGVCGNTGDSSGYHLHFEIAHCSKGKNQQGNYFDTEKGSSKWGTNGWKVLKPDLQMYTTDRNETGPVSADTLEIRNVVYPEIYNIDSPTGFDLQGGYVISNVNLVSLEAKIVDANGERISYMREEEHNVLKISGKVFLINELEGRGKDMGQKFSSIEKKGEYTWILTATDENGNSVTLQMPFTADKKATKTATKSSFEQTKTYTITWKNDDGTIIKTTKVPEGNTPSLANPVKANTSEYEYIFAGWSPAITAATKDAVYTATFTSKKIEPWLKISDDAVYPSGKREKGKSMTLTGTITSNQKITEVVGSIYDDSTNKLVDANTFSTKTNPCVVKPNATSYNLNSNDFDRKIKIGQLPDGTYRYEVKATTESGYSKVLINSKFTVGTGTKVNSKDKYSGADYTSNSDLAKKLDALFNDGVAIFTNDTKKFKVGDYIDNSKTYYWKGYSYSGMQCYAYGQAAYYYLFGDVPYHGNNSYSYSKAITGVSKLNKLSYDILDAKGIGCGAYIRTTANSDGSHSDKGHSMIILSYDQSSITVLNGNAGGTGAIKITKWESWDDFNRDQLSGRGRYVDCIVQPNVTAITRKTSPYESVYRFIKDSTTKSQPSIGSKDVKQCINGSLIDIAKVVNVYEGDMWVDRWFETPEGTYVHEEDVELFYFVAENWADQNKTKVYRANTKTKYWSLPYTGDINGQSFSLKAGEFSKGDEFIVVKKVSNKHNQTWYQMDNGFFIHYSVCDLDHVVITINKKEYQSANILKSSPITWLNEDGSVIDTTNVEHGTVPTHEAPTKTGTADKTYVFSGWTPNVVAVSGPATYQATFSEAKNSCTITWKHEDGTIIDTTTVEYGTVPTHAEPQKAGTVTTGYEFAGWEPAVTAVTGNSEYKATFTPYKILYSVVWRNADGSTMKVDSLEYGAMPAYTGETPALPATADATYTFKGWTPAISPVTGSITYTAEYDAVAKEPSSSYYTYSGSGQNYVKDSGEDKQFSVKRSEDDDKTFSLFRGIQTDGVDVDASNYEASKGSVVIKLKASYLETLAVGDHVLTVLFEDGKDDIPFTVSAAETPVKPIDPTKYTDVAVPSDSFTFKKVWQGDSEKSIDFTLYKADGTVYHHGFDKKVVSNREWRYNAWFSAPAACYVIEKPIPGYQTKYVNVGVYAHVTDRCCDGGTIINKKIPKTGDTADLALWAGLMLVGIAGLTTLVLVKKCRKAEK